MFEKFLDAVIHAGELAQDVGEKWVGKSLILHKSCDDCGGNGDIVPPLRDKGGRGDGLALCVDFGRGLERPMIAEGKSLGLRCLLRGRACGRVRRCGEKELRAEKQSCEKLCESAPEGSWQS